MLPAEHSPYQTFYDACRRTMHRYISYVLMLLLAGTIITPAITPAIAQTDASGKNFIPYFASLRYQKTFVRSGPGRNYPVLYIYNQEYLPLEVISQLDDWLQIRDWSGDQGWILYNQTKRKTRYAIVILEEIAMYQQPDKTSNKVARLGYEVTGKIQKCDLQWCRVNVKGNDGWTRRAGLWGLYPNELIE